MKLNFKPITHKVSAKSDTFIQAVRDAVHDTLTAKLAKGSVNYSHIMLAHGRFLAKTLKSLKDLDKSKYGGLSKFDIVKAICGDKDFAQMTDLEWIDFGTKVAKAINFVGFPPNIDSAKEAFQICTVRFAQDSQRLGGSLVLADVAEIQEDILDEILENEMSDVVLPATA